jgi:2-polyprenyl-3-methyl-5-hydroxy-6-metoxy-1,4-benzoquinol methylase
MTDFNNSYVGLRHDILKYIEGEGNVIMDVGCANGVNGKYLIDNKNASEVYGIEYDPDMAAVATLKYTKVFQGNLDNSEFLKEIISNTTMCDYILFGDVLEHLNKPEIVLKELVKKLKCDGKVIISIPNVAHLETFIQIFIKGTWPKNSRGIFDETHLRWFTRKDAIQLIKKSGLDVIKYERKFRARDAIGSKFNLLYYLLKYLNRDWLTFQYIIYCRIAK